MAGATEVEQIKSNQLLEKVSKDTSESLRAMDDLISAVKQPSEYEKEAIASDKESTELDKKAQKHDKEVLKGDKIFHKDFDEFSKKEIIHNKFIETTEKKKEGIAKAALADQKRKEKLLTRTAKGAWDWTKDKASGIAKSTMGFMETVGKLMLLVAAWFLLLWLKGKDLKKWWDSFLEKIEKWKETLEKWTKWVTDMTKDLNDEYVHFTTAWLAWKTMLKAASSTLNAIATGMKTWFGVDAVMSRRLAKLSTNITNLLKEEAALQRLLNVTDDLATKKPLALKLKEVRTALAATLQDEAAIVRAQKFAETLQKDKLLAKQLGLADDALILATTDEAAAQKALKLGKALAPESKAALKLAEATEEIAKITKEKSVLHEAIRLNQELRLSLAQDARAAKLSLETAQKIKDTNIAVKPVKSSRTVDPRLNPNLAKYLESVGLKEGGIIDTAEEIKAEAKILGETNKQRKKFKGSVHAESWGAWWADKTKGIRLLLREHQRLGLAGSVGKLVGSGFEKVKLASEAIGLTGWIKKALKFLGILGDLLLAIEAIRGIWGGEKTPGGKGISAGIGSASMIMTTDMATVVENFFDKFWGDKVWGGDIGIDWKPMKERWMTKFASWANDNLWGELFNKIGDPKKDDQGNLVFNKETGEQEFVEWWNWFALRGGASVTDEEGKQWKPIANAFLNAFEEGGVFKGPQTLMAYLALRLKGYDFAYDPTGKSKSHLDLKNLRDRSSETESKAMDSFVVELKKIAEAIKLAGENQLNELSRNAGVLAPVTVHNATSVLSAGPRADHSGSDEIKSIYKD